MFTTVQFLIWDLDKNARTFQKFLDIINKTSNRLQSRVLNNEIPLSLPEIKRLKHSRLSRFYVIKSKIDSLAFHLNLLKISSNISSVFVCFQTFRLLHLQKTSMISDDFQTTGHLTHNEQIICSSWYLFGFVSGARRMN